MELIRRTWCQQGREPYDWQEEADSPVNLDDIAQGCHQDTAQQTHSHITHITLQKPDNKQRPELLLSKEYQA